MPLQRYNPSPAPSSPGSEVYGGNLPRQDAHFAAAPIEFKRYKVPQIDDPFALSLGEINFFEAESEEEQMGNDDEEEEEEEEVEQVEQDEEWEEEEQIEGEDERGGTQEEIVVAGAKRVSQWLL